ncbi:hypothetical protein H4N54_25165 [Limnospira fusiformis KN01]|nr:MULTISPECIES: hypothetical protein [Limnospira]ULB45633.1 hypothetical protein H4N54_25165 [Limnospira fusiformis KN01]
MFNFGTGLITIVFISFYLAGLAVIGYKVFNEKNHEDYIIGSRNVGYISTAGSIGAGFRDGVGLIFWIGTGFTIGYGGLWLICGMMTSIFLLSIIGPRFRETAKKENYINISDMLSAHLGRITELTVSVIILVFSSVYVAIQIFVISNLLQEIFSISFYFSACTTFLVVAIYMVSGGYSSVVKTDVIQLVLVFMLIFVPFFIRPSVSNILDLNSLFSLNLLDSIGLFGIGFLSITSGAEVWQRIISAKNNHVIRVSFPISAIILLIMTLSLIFIGFGAQQILESEIASDQVLFMLFKEQGIPSLILAYIAVAIIAASMSTLDTFAYVFCSTFIKNLLTQKNTFSQEKYVKTSRVVVVIFLAIMTIFSASITDIIRLLFDASSFLFIMTPVFLLGIAGFIEKSNYLDKYIALSMWISSALYVFLFINGYFTNLLINLIPAMLCFVLCLLFILHYRKIRHT